MLASAIHIFGRNLDYAHRLVSDVPEEKMAALPAAGMNHAAWVLGHLAWTCDFGMFLFGHGPALDETWVRRFDNNSKPESDSASYPNKTALLSALEAGHTRLVEAVKKAAPDNFARPLPFEDFRAAFPTVGDITLHLLTSHEAGHLGQLSAWRRVLGMPAV
mgnify:CR=1 FL=1